MKKRFMPFAMFIVTVLFSGNVYAEETRTKILLHEEITVTATRGERNLNKVASSVSIITKKDIERSSAKYVDELLSEYAGIIVTRPQGAGSARTWVRLRGFPHPRATLVMKDGIPINRYACGGAKWNELPVKIVERIEIVRGASSSLYGSSAMGGVINIITKKTEPKSKCNINSSMGSNSAYTVNATFSGYLIDNLSYIMHLNIFQNTGYDSWDYDAITNAKIEAMMKKGKTQAQAEKIVGNIMDAFKENAVNQDRNAYNFFCNFNYWLTGNSKLTFGYSKWDEETTMGRKYFIKNFKRDRFTAGYIKKDGNLKISSNIFYLDERFGDTYDAKPNPKKSYWGYDKIEMEDIIPVKDMGGNLTLTSPLGSKQLLTYGIDYRNGEMENESVWESGRKTVAKGKQSRWSVFGQDEIELGKLLLNLSARYDWFKTKDGSYTDSSDPTQNAEYSSKSDEIINPKIGLAYNISDLTAVKLSVGKASDVPYLYSLFGTFECPPGKMRVGNPDIEPEQTIDYEVGIEQKFLKNFTANLFYFYNDISDWMDIVFWKEEDGTKKFKWHNIDKVKTNGVELGLRYKLSNFSLLANYTYLKTEVEKIDADILSGSYISEDYEGNWLTGQPEHNVSICLVYEHPKIATFKLTGHYEGERYDDLENTKKLNGYTNFSVNISRKIKKHISAAVSVRDIFDKQWKESWNLKTPGREITGKVEMTF